MEIDDILKGVGNDHHEEKIQPIQSALIMTTIVVDSRDMDDFTIHQYRQVQLVDMQYKIRLLNGECCTPIVFIRSLDGSMFSELYKKDVVQFLNPFSRNIRIYFMDDGIEPYLKSFADYSFREMRKRKLIQFVPKFSLLRDDKMYEIHQKTMVKFYLKKPYPAELQQFSDRKLYIPATCGSDLTKLLSNIWCIVHNASFGVYETSTENELVICDQALASNLSYQNHTKTRGIAISLGKFDCACLRGARVKCEIIPHDLIVDTENRYYKHLYSFYSDYRMDSALKMHCPNNSERELLQSNARKFKSIEELHGYLETTWAGKMLEKEQYEIYDWNEIPVRIQLDANISSKMLKFKLSEKKLYDEYSLREKLKSILFQRGLAFDYGFTSAHSTVVLENKWCLMKNVNEWFQDKVIDRNDQLGLGIQKILDKKLLISTTSEFKLLEKVYNYFTSSTFALCWDFFKTNDIQVSQLSDEIWEYILNPSCKSHNDTIFYTLQQNISNHRDVEIIEHPIKGDIRACLSVLSRRRPYSFLYHNFPHLKTMYMSTRLPEKRLRYMRYFPDSLNMQSFSDVFNTNDISSLKEKLLRTILYKLLVNKKRTFKFPVQEGILDKFIRSESYKILERSKKNYETGNYNQIVKDFMNLWFQLKWVTKIKRKLKQEYSGILFEVIDRMSIAIFPIAPIFSSYVQKNIFNTTSIENIRWPDMQYPQVELGSTYRFIVKLYNRIKKLVRDNQQTEPLIIELSNKSRKINHELFIEETKQMFMDLFPSVADIIMQNDP